MGSASSESHDNKSEGMSSAQMENSKLLELARKQRMNTDVRKNVFLIMMTSEVKIIFWTNNFLWVKLKVGATVANVTTAKCNVYNYPIYAVMWIRIVCKWLGNECWWWEAFSNANKQLLKNLWICPREENKVDTWAGCNWSYENHPQFLCRL